VREISDTEPITLVNSLNPYRIEGQKTASFEVIDHLGLSLPIIASPLEMQGISLLTGKGIKSIGKRAVWKVFRRCLDFRQKERPLL